MPPVRDTMRLAVQHLQANELGQAERLCRQVLEQSPHHARALHLLGIICFQVGKRLQAVQNIRAAIAQNATVAEFHYHLGEVLRSLEQPAEAEPCYRAALALEPDHLDTLRSLGLLLRLQRQHAEALPCCEQVVRLRPEEASSHAELGATLHALGRVAEAQAAYQRAVRLQPDLILTHWNLSRLKTYTRDDPDIAALEALAPPPGQTRQHAEHLYFTLGKAYEDIGEYERAFAALREGNRLKRQSLQYDVSAHLQFFAATAAHFTADRVQALQGAGCPAEWPVFIVGMPRSGTTLIEQILASHPQIHGAGERTFLTQASNRVTGLDGKPVPFPQCVRHLDREQCRQLGEEVTRRMRELGPAAARVVDKLPENFVFTGLIHLLLPNARIIHCQRSAVDVCVSCYGLLFRHNLEWSYDLEEAGRFWLSYRDLMDHWRQVLPPGRMLEVQYEEVVADLETQARRLIDYCGLPWDDACLSFHTTERPVFTPSAGQVRQPIYQSSVERWRRYEQHLGPLLAVLQQGERKA